MKKLLLFTMLFATMANAQTSLSISQDARLAFLGDDKGNKAFTPNITLRATQAIRTIEWFSFLTYADYEYADLQDTFHKWNFGFGINLRLFNDKIEIQSTYGGGRIYRGKAKKDFASWDLSGNIAYNFNHTVAIFVELQQTKRADLKYQPFVYSGKVGVRFQIGRLPLFRD